ncbi:hypothetical protein THAOC_31772 [Thalassiosira oceanica]|uniref:Uncharacterized protein n=1 Tax=Thalassiosira oceanica TaxID=159749 RepID=K0R7E8_THAOC|nr:hypothetical protein THAOC_31772 [Thalassiosira oceanica]|eukprot:EJK49358.1 hypothetical protein THAOC_31772 [Thalassiosira oceanica]
MLDHRSGHPVQWESEEVPRSPGGGRDDARENDGTGPGAATAAGKARYLVRFRCVCPVPPGSDVHNNYGPKGNPELLVTYGFAVQGNPFDSVDGIVLGARHDGDDGVCRERARLATEGGVPHAIGGGTIRLGPFSLHAGAGGDAKTGATATKAAG